MGSRKKYLLFHQPAKIDEAPRALLHSKGGEKLNKILRIRWLEVFDLLGNFSQDGSFVVIPM